MLKVNQNETTIEGGLAEILAEYATLTMHVFNAIGKDCGPAVAEVMVLKAFIMGNQHAGNAAGAQKEAPDA